MEKISLDLPATKRVFELQLFKCYKALRPKTSYVLVQIPNEFINGHYAGGLKYGVTMGIDEQGHRVILVDLDDQKKMLNNRKVEK
jgi:hypothetical protein